MLQHRMDLNYSDKRDCISSNSVSLLRMLIKFHLYLSVYHFSAKNFSFALLVGIAFVLVSSF